MKSHVAICKSHDEAMGALKVLSEKGFPMENVSLIGNAEIVEDHIRVKSLENVKFAPFAISLIACVGVGILSGLGLVKVPGVEFTHNAGMLVNVFAGFNFGLLFGAIATIVTALILKSDKVLKYKEHLETKNFLVMVNGTLKDIRDAEHILHTEGAHLKTA